MKNDTKSPSKEEKGVPKVRLQTSEGWRRSKKKEMKEKNKNASWGLKFDFLYLYKIIKGHGKKNYYHNPS